jgi:cyclic-di-AMP phosphodiesterase PgpH
MRLSHRLYSVGWLLALWVLLSATLLVDLQPGDSRLEVGAVSPLSIRAPERVTFQSEVRTLREREKAAGAVEPVYSPPDRSQAVRQTGTVDAVATYLDAIRADPYATDTRKIEQIRALQPIQFDPAIAETILTLPEVEWREVVAETQRLVDAQMRAEIRESRLPAIQRGLPNQISVSLSDQQAQVVGAWAGGLITPNTFLDAERTEQLREAARAAVPPVEVTYEAGQIVVREGEIVQSEQVEALQALGLQGPARTLGTSLATALFLFLLVVVFLMYIQRIHPEHWVNPRAMGMIIAILAALTLGARIILPDHVLLSYLFPTSIAAMLLAVLLGVDVAIVATIILSLVVGYLTNSIEMATYTFVGGMVAALLLWRVERLGAFVWTGVLVGLTNLGVVLAFSLLDVSRTWIDMATLGGMALLNGAASASLALAGFYVLSNFLGITTFVQLMELAHPNHPLFRALLLQAPGTYHHTIIVSNLAERAAEAVGADVLLVRVGAYYHDVGKIANPHFFIENQADGVNLHDTIDDPYRSAEIILDHVPEGVRLARRYKLPRRIVDMIAQHHGTTSVAWFHARACQVEGEESVDLAHFQYPGPKPQSREAAILMLADTVEATARAVKPAGVEEIDLLVRKLMATKLSEGQLDECDLNLRDMDTMRRAFVDVLQGIYHPRISYPERVPALASVPSPLPVKAELLPAQVESHERPEQPSAADRPAVGSTG